jgi:HD-GYP domain-containing protein (c-di-GMP phosphodiesterase class II)
MVIDELTTLRSIAAALNTATHISHQRDVETGSHLDRMSRYSQLIAQKLASRYDLSDEFIEHVFMFAPLHDIGKVAIPDNILLKKGPLNAAERLIMNTHALKGLEIVDQMIANFQFSSVPYLEILRNIVRYHHEAINGLGYPEQLKAGQIPLEARIVAAADVLDALTSKRPYKEAWSVDRAFQHMQTLSGNQLDADCVDVLLEHRAEVEAIMQQFTETLTG